MLKMATEALDQLRPISSIAVRFDGDEWVPWMPDVTHPLHKPFRRLYFDAMGRDYAEQKELLDRLHAKTNKNIFVIHLVTAYERFRRQSNSPQWEVHFSQSPRSPSRGDQRSRSLQAHPAEWSGWPQWPAHGRRTRRCFRRSASQSSARRSAYPVAAWPP